MRTRRRFMLLLGMLIVYWLLIFALTHLPIPDAAKLSRKWIPHSDKIVHACLYFVLAGLLTGFLSTVPRMRHHAAALTMAIVMVYGIFDEGLQEFVPSRTADPLDYVADLVGALLGIVTYLVARRLYRSMFRQNSMPVPDNTVSDS